jgi:hypothetical protein
MVALFGKPAAKIFSSSALHFVHSLKIFVCEFVKLDSAVKCHFKHFFFTSMPRHTSFFPTFFIILSPLTFCSFLNAQIAQNIFEVKIKTPYIESIREKKHWQCFAYGLDVPEASTNNSNPNIPDGHNNINTVCDADPVNTHVYQKQEQ